MMSEESPTKLFTNKPKKSKLKPVTPSTMATSSSTGAASVVPPPPPPKESFARRYKYMWPLLLAVNFVVGAYLFSRTRKKDVGTEEAEKPEAHATSTPISPPAAQATIGENLVTQPTVEPVQHAPIPGDQQREMYKWLLEERRKIKPKDGEEKKRIDEEKAILKEFIRAKTSGRCCCWFRTIELFDGIWKSKMELYLLLKGLLFLNPGYRRNRLKSWNCDTLKGDKFQSGKKEVGRIEFALS